MAFGNTQRDGTTGPGSEQEVEPGFGTSDSASRGPNFAATLENYAAVIIQQEDLPFAPEEWVELEALCNAIPYEQVIKGDAGDKHSVYVGRFVNDVEKPEILHPSAERMLTLLSQPTLMALYSSILGPGDFCIRRCQVNVIPEGGFVGYHVDQDANPDYLVAVIVHFSDTYDGGEYVVHHPAQGTRSYRPKAPSMMISRGDIPHEVGLVKRGERKTLVYFLSRNFGPTRNKREPITTA